MKILFDFDGVFNALNRGIALVNDGYGSYLVKDVTILHGGRNRTFPIMYRPAVVEWFNSLVDRGVDVRWLTTWREHTSMFPEWFGFVPAPWVSWQDTSYGWGKFNAVRSACGEDVIWVDDHHPYFNSLTDQHCLANRIHKITPVDRYGLVGADIETIEGILDGVH